MERTQKTPLCCMLRQKTTVECVHIVGQDRRSRSLTSFVLET
jgi:hypothetical protein